MSGKIILLDLKKKKKTFDIADVFFFFFFQSCLKSYCIIQKTLLVLLSVSALQGKVTKAKADCVLNLTRQMASFLFFLHFLFFFYILLNLFLKAIRRRQSQRHICLQRECVVLSRGSFDWMNSSVCHKLVMVRCKCWRF